MICSRSIFGSSWKRIVRGAVAGLWWSEIVRPR